MSRCDDFIYDSQPVYDVYGDEDWYLWFRSHDCAYEKKIDEEAYVQIREIPKNPFRSVHVCAAAGKQASRIPSPLDRRDFWICDPRLTDARFDRSDFRFEFYSRSYDFMKFPQFLNLVFGVQEKISRDKKSEIDDVNDMFSFDPGGFESKLETSFLKEGENDDGQISRI